MLLADLGGGHLTQRGIDKETAEYFGVGFFSSKGSMAGRIVIPIENEGGELVAYAGRSIDGSEPKYRLSFTPRDCGNLRHGGRPGQGEDG